MSVPLDADLIPIAIRGQVSSIRASANAEVATEGSLEMSQETHPFPAIAQTLTNVPRLAALQTPLALMGLINAPACVPLASKE